MERKGGRGRERERGGTGRFVDTRHVRRIRKGRRKRHVQAYPYTRLSHRLHNRFGITLSIEISARRGRRAVRRGCNLTPRWIIFRRKLLPKVSTSVCGGRRHTCPPARCEFRMSKIWYTRAAVARVIADNTETVDGDGDCRKSHDSPHVASKRKIRAGSPIRVTLGPIMRSLIFIARENADNVMAGRRCREFANEGERERESNSCTSWLRIIKQFIVKDGRIQNWSSIDGKESKM